MAEVDDTVAENIADVDEERTDDKAEVDKDDSDDDAREDAFDAVIIDAQAGELGIDDDENEDNEDDVGKVAHVLPDEIDGRAVVGRDSVDFEEFVEDAGDVVDERAKKSGGGTDNPKELAGLFSTDTFFFLFVLLFVFAVGCFPVIFGIRLVGIGLVVGVARIRRG